MRKDVLEFLSTTFEVVVLLVWHFLVLILFFGKEGIGIRVELTSLSLSQGDGDNIVIVDGHERCQVRLRVKRRGEKGAIVRHGILVRVDVEAEGGREGR